VVKTLGPGGQRLAQRELGWCRDTIRKGMHELESGIRCEDNFAARGRKRAEYHLPNLLSDLEMIVASQSQTDSTFETNRLYTRLSTAYVRRQLIQQKDYTNEGLPTEETIRVKLNELGYQLRSVTKSRPKKIPQTDAIFSKLNEVRVASDTSKTTLRLSLDAKATINIGAFCRGGKSRVNVKAYDHDFTPTATVTPFGIFLPQSNESFY